MQIITKIEINKDPNLKKYLKEHSYWYKYLNRNHRYISLVRENMKKAYKITPADHIKRISDNISLVSNILQILK